jgi:hypothetical protein
METVQLSTAVDLVFAAGVVVAALALAGAALRLAARWALNLATALEALAAVAGWVVFALRHDRPLAVAAGGLSACALAAAGSLLLHRALRRLSVLDARFERERERLAAFVAKEAADRAVELERTLARARADSASLLEQQERTIAEERRVLFAEREREATATLSERLTHVQAQVEQRLAGWAQDLDRAADATKTRIAELGHRQHQLLSEVELRLTADAERLAAESDEQRTAIARLRSELDRTLEESLAATSAEIDAHSVERRRALHELEERIRRREHELLELLEREETEAALRIRTTFEEVARRQVEQMERLVERGVSSYADEAAQQFAGMIKAAREDAAKRLARELDRAVGVFAREAETVLAERLAHVGDVGSQRLEQRLGDVTAALEHQHDSWTADVEQRIRDLETEVRRRLEELVADAEAERAVLEARLQELSRRADTAPALGNS